MNSNYEVKILEHHLDTFGHVNNATYFQLFEQARWEVITARGFGLKEVRTTQQGPIVLDAQIRFLHELRLREQITIVTECAPFTGKTAKIVQKMLRSDGEVACDVSYTIAFFDLRARKIIPPSAAWLLATGLA